MISLKEHCKWAALAVFLTLLASLGPLKGKKIPNEGDPVLYAVLFDHLTKTIQKNPGNILEAGFYHPSPRPILCGEHFVGLAPFLLVLRPFTETPMDLYLTYQWLQTVLLALGFFVLIAVNCKGQNGKNLMAAAVTASICATIPWYWGVAFRPSVGSCFLLPLIWASLIKQIQTNQSRFGWIAGTLAAWQLLISFNFSLVLFLTWVVFIIAQPRLLKDWKGVLGWVIPWLPLIPLALAYQNDLTPVPSLNEIQDLSPGFRAFFNPYQGYPLPYPQAYFENPGLVSEHALFPGWAMILALGFFLSPLVVKEKIPHYSFYRKLLWVGSIITFLCMLGPYPFGGEIPGPHAFLVKIFPPFRALRSTGRLCMVLLPALALVAGFAVSQVPRNRFLSIWVLWGGMAILGFCARPEGTPYVPRLSEVDRYLKRHSQGAVLEWPPNFDQDNAQVFEKVHKMYRARFHGHRISTGYGSFIPPESYKIWKDAKNKKPAAELMDAYDFTWIRTAKPLPIKARSQAPGDFLYHREDLPEGPITLPPAP